MEKILKHKETILYLLALTVLCLIFFFGAYARFGVFFIDTSREAYIPYAMNKGFVLYKDIFNIFPPLSYQINALIYHLFNGHLSAFYYAGLINAVIFISGLFASGCIIAKNSKLFSFLFCAFVISSCIFAVSHTNYILPYAYAAVYSLSASVWALFFLLSYFKNGVQGCIISAFFLFGAAVCFKYDCIFFIFPLLGVLLYKKADLKLVLKCLAAASLPVLLSFSILFFQGVSLQDLKEAYIYISGLLKSESSIYCYKFLGIIPSYASLKTAGLNFIKTAPVLMLIFAAVYKIAALKNLIIKTALLTAFIAASVLILKPVLTVSNAYYFSWIGMAAVFSFLLFSIYMIKKYCHFEGVPEKSSSRPAVRFFTRFLRASGAQNDDLRGQALDINDKMFFLLFLSVLFISIKSITAVNFNNYGSYYFPFFGLCIFSVLFHYSARSKEAETAFYIVLTVLFFSYAFSNIERRAFAFNSRIETPKGVIYTEEDAAPVISHALEYLKYYTSSKDKVLVLPEGAMINHLAQRISDNKYFYLIPSNIEVFGADKITEDLKNSLPDYIILQPLSYNNFGHTYFCESFGKEICALLPEYYEKPIVLGWDFWLALYKKKENYGK